MTSKQVNKINHEYNTEYNTPDAQNQDDENHDTGYIKYDNITKSLHTVSYGKSSKRKHGKCIVMHVLEFTPAFTQNSKGKPFALMHQKFH